MPAMELSIGEAARETGLNVKTIRYYEQIGLIPAARRHDGFAHTGGNRLFDAAAIGRLKFIHHARMLELGLDEIRVLLEPLETGHCPGGVRRYREILRNHLQQIDERVAHLLGLRERIETLLRQHNGGDPGPCHMATCQCMEHRSDASAKVESAAQSGCACRH
ncbi:MAG: MerR family transcriptional regulator [Rhodanobacter sp.]|nr:MAG: MerR family transcriptional regulator [Rhodanobacter sp.]TAL99612.1 MAG: MerR family transcriptional regulator [Rhodanobacter sp.]TAM41019.1 MAG: MerR family transcriptional regulator [Rhodanobacter sp.]